MAYQFLKYREQNKDKKKSVKFFQEFIPPKKVLIGGNDTNKVDVHKIEMEMILSLIDGVAFLTKIMTIWYGSISKSEVILHKSLE